MQIKKEKKKKVFNCSDYCRKSCQISEIILNIIVDIIK